MPSAILPDISAGELKGATGSSIIERRALETFSHFQTATFNLDVVIDHVIKHFYYTRVLFRSL